MKVINNITEKENNLTEKENNGACLTSLVLGICSVFLYQLIILPILSIIFGIMGITSIDDEKEKGKGYGVTGIILGIIYLMMAVYYDA